MLSLMSIMEPVWSIVSIRGQDEKQAHHSSRLSVCISVKPSSKSIILIFLSLLTRVILLDFISNKICKLVISIFVGMFVCIFSHEFLFGYIHILILKDTSF